MRLCGLHSNKLHVSFHLLKTAFRNIIAAIYAFMRAATVERDATKAPSQTFWICDDLSTVKGMQEEAGKIKSSKAGEAQAENISFHTM